MHLADAGATDFDVSYDRINNGMENVGKLISWLILIISIEV